MYETRLKKSTRIVKNSIATEWRYVDTHNTFVFMNQTFVISEEVEEYKVTNKAGEVEDFTNEAYMEEVLVVIDKQNNLKFYNQDYNEIPRNLVTVKESEG